MNGRSDNLDVIHLGGMAISTPLYTANLAGDGVTLAVGFTPEASSDGKEQWISLLWQLTFDHGYDFPTNIIDSMIGGMNLEALDSVLNNSESVEFQFGGYCTDIRIYIGKWGIRSGFIVELLYNPGEYGRWPREELATFLLDRSGPILNHQLGFICDYEALSQFHTDLKTVKTNLEIGG